MPQCNSDNNNEPATSRQDNKSDTHTDTQVHAHTRTHTLTHFRGFDITAIIAKLSLDFAPTCRAYWQTRTKTLSHTHTHSASQKAQRQKRSQTGYNECESGVKWRPGASVVKIRHNGRPFVAPPQQIECYYTLIVYFRHDNAQFCVARRRKSPCYNAYKAIYRAEPIVHQSIALLMPYIYIYICMA